MPGPVFFRRKFLNKEYAREMYDQGYCDQHIADNCGVSRECIREWRRRNNLEGHKAPPKVKPKPKESTLIAMAAEAKAHKMTYGQYMAAKREGKI